VEITLKEKKTKDYMGGLKEQVVKKPKMVKDKGVGLLVELVIQKMVRNLVVEKMHPKVEKEDVDLHVPLVKLIKGGKENELGRYSKKEKVWQMY
tara:strand:- start:301 stop:582 length:282 start_codon:yes stop_codon:yes gene_type:complete